MSPVVTLRAAVAMLALLSAACSNVAPYEREFLADPIMQLNADGESRAYEDHMHRALSQGLIGAPSGGGGCGCEQ